MTVMSGLDARFLFSETPAAHMHTIKVVVVDVSGRSEPLTPDGLPALIEDRLRRMPVLRRRVVPVPHGLGNPVVIDDPDFELSRHLRTTAAAPPGGAHELDEVVARIARTPLPRDRPLWELTVVEGIGPDRIAFVMKLHHPLADGVAAVELLEDAFVVDDDDAVDEPFRPEPVPSDRELYATAAATTARAVAELPLVAGRTVRGTVRALRARSAEPTAPPGPFAGPRTPFDAALTPDRTFATVALPMQELTAVKRAAGATLNDAFLALVGGATRRYLDRIGRLPASSLIASVPMSTRTERPQLGGNHVDNLFLPLRSDLADPGERARAIHDAAVTARRVRSEFGPELFEARGRGAAAGGAVAGPPRVERDRPGRTGATTAEPGGVVRARPAVPSRAGRRRRDLAVLLGTDPRGRRGERDRLELRRHPLRVDPRVLGLAAGPGRPRRRHGGRVGGLDGPLLSRRYGCCHNLLEGGPCRTSPHPRTRARTT